MKCRYQYQQVKRKGRTRLETITCYNCMYAHTEECKKEQEKWNGVHGQVIAPKGTFDKIYEEAEEDEYDI